MADIITYNNIISVFEDIASRHYQIKTFKVGDQWEEDANTVEYPMLVVNPTSAYMQRAGDDMGYATFEISMNVLISDQVYKGEENENDVVSDTLQMIQDIIVEFNKHPYYTNSRFDVVGDLNFIPFTERNDDEVSGWEVGMTLRTPNIRNFCGIPVSDISGFEFDRPTCGTSGAVGHACLCIRSLTADEPIFITETDGTYNWSLDPDFVTAATSGHTTIVGVDPILVSGTSGVADYQISLNPDFVTAATSGSASSSGVGAIFPYVFIVGTTDHVVPTFGINSMDTVSNGSAILGGYGHNVSLSTSSNILNGLINTIENSQSSILLGGNRNSITLSNDAFIGTGVYNTLNGSDKSILLGGASNGISFSTNSFLAQGSSNVISLGSNNTIANGKSNIIQTSSSYSSILNGVSNTISSSSKATVVGGRNNSITSSTYATVLNGQGCVITGSSYGIASGRDNDLTTSPQSLVMSGRYNSITSSSDSAIVSGYDSDTSSSDYSFIGGGGGHSMVSSSNSAILGGYNGAITSSSHSSIAGGNGSKIYNSDNSFIGGGKNAYIYSTSPGNVIVGGGNNFGFNKIYGGAGQTYNNFIGGGSKNYINSTTNFVNYSVIVGGNKHTISDSQTFIGGGYQNSILKTTGTSLRSAIVGGNVNTITNGIYSFIGAGDTLSITDSRNSNILNGDTNTITTTSDYSNILNGLNNTITNSKKSTIVGGVGASITNSERAIILGNVYNNSYGYISNSKTSLLFGDNKIVGKVSFGQNQSLGGWYNQINNSDYATQIGGCYTNITYATYSNVIGGSYNISTIGNQITGANGSSGLVDNSFIMGSGNIIDASSSTIIGNNSSSGFANTIILGDNIVADKAGSNGQSIVYVHNLDVSGRVEMASFEGSAGTSGTLTFDLEDSNIFDYFYPGAMELDYTNAEIGTYQFILRGQTTASATTFATSKWSASGGEAPTLTATSGAIDVITATYDGSRMIIVTTPDIQDI
jgi:hypothetical protein